MLKFWKISLNVIGLALFALSLPLPSEANLFRVVIDPGHGGSDEGTVFDNGRVHISEKKMTLLLAKKVAYQLRKKGFEVTLTRLKDQEVALPERTAIANRLQADVFISLHMNSTHGTSLSDAEGVETFILDNATDASSRRLARLENSVLTAQNPKSHEQRDVALILKDLRLDANLAESKQLACNVQSMLVLSTSKSDQNTKTQKNRIKNRNRGVKQALFHVLLGADMPSILVEAGFLNNHHDRAYILSPKGQLVMSKAIADAVERYKLTKDFPKKSHQLARCKIN